MELLTQDLPSGYNYPFPSIQIKPMFFAQILEYLENLPKNPVERYYFDYKLVLGDDPNIDHLLITDLDYVVFLKKGLTIDENLSFKTSANCPYCGSSIAVHFNLSDVKFKKIDEESLYGLTIKFCGTEQIVRVPTVTEFMKIFSNYRRYKRVSDMRLIKLIALFTESLNYQQKIEELIINAQYEDITMLTILDQIYYDTVSPISGYCLACKDKFGLDKARGVEIGIDSLISDFFRDVIENNRLDQSKIIPRKIR